MILLPDGSLYGLNFETLLVPAPKPHFWIEDVTLTTASSLTLLSAGRNARKQDAGATFASERRDMAGTFRYGNLLLVGDATQAAAEFPVLRQAQAEMAQVGRYFPEARRAILSGAHATPSAFLNSEPEKFAAEEKKGDRLATVRRSHNQDPGRSTAETSTSEANAETQRAPRNAERKFPNSSCEAKKLGNTSAERVERGAVVTPSSRVFA